MDGGRRGEGGYMVNNIAPSRRTSAFARMAWGGLLLVLPYPVLRLLGRPTPLAAATMRVLALRHLVQAAVTMRRPTPRVLMVGAAGDALHASTALALAAVDRRQRRISLLDTVIATIWIALDIRAARHRRAAWYRRDPGYRPARSSNPPGRRVAWSLARSGRGL
jgi:hypothetical protein